MKTPAPLSSTFLVLMLLSLSLQADFTPVDRFDQRPLGPIAPQPDWAGTSGTGTVELDPTDSQNHVLAVRTNSGILRRPLTIPDGGGQMLFFRLRFGHQQNYSLGLSPLTSPSEFSDFSPEIGMASATNKLRVWEGGVDNYEDITTLQDDTWYNLWVFVNTTNDTFRIWINDRPCAAAMASDQLDLEGNPVFGFRSGVGSAGLRTFYLKTGGGIGGMGASDGPFFIDDLYLDDSPGAINLDNPTVPRADYLEDFESGSLRGWTSDAPSLESQGGLDGSAYLKGQRLALAPIFLPTTDSAGNHLLGNLGACYGSEIRISYYGHTLSGNSLPIYHNFFIAPLHASSTYWSKVVSQGSASYYLDWTKAQFHLDTEWSDAEAEAHGWTRLRGSDSWTDTLANLGRSEFFKGSGDTGRMRIAGIDSIRIGPSPVPVDGLRAYYPFDRNADDASGNHYNGIPNGATLTEDAACTPLSAFAFDGDNDLINISGFGGAPAEGTIAAWVTVEDFDLGSNQLNLIFGQNDNLQLGLGDSSIGADGLWVFRHRSGSFHNAIGPAPELNRWTHVAGVWDGSDAILYIDGTEVARVASGPLTPSASAARIGAHPSASQNYWDGKVDEVLLYERALTPAEITHLASAVSFSDGPPRITSLDLVGTTASLRWEPPLQRAFIDFSTDLISWTPITAPLTGCRWSGELPGGSSHGFVRVRSEPDEIGTP